MDTQARLLLVEPSIALRHLLQDLLSEAGFTELDEAGDGSVAFEMIREVPYDLIIANWTTPRLDGAAFLRTLHQWPGRQHIPVLVLTDASVAEAHRAGASGVVNMPFRAAEFLDEVARLLRPTSVEAHA